MHDLLNTFILNCLLNTNNWVLKSMPAFGGGGGLLGKGIFIFALSLKKRQQKKPNPIETINSLRMLDVF